MSTQQTNIMKMTNFRWTICAMLFFATTVNYLDRQVLSLTWDEFIKPEFHWDENNYGTIVSVFSIVYAIAMLFSGRFIDWLGTKKGYFIAIGIWSVGACMHALCGVATESYVGVHDATQLIQA
ncbi:MAG: MFS transporter, partial [Bacteroidaceae bacterium]|nr:MFS transporter [Bacteroidaceae bacterium]